MFPINLNLFTGPVLSSPVRSKERVSGMFLSSMIYWVLSLLAFSSMTFANDNCRMINVKSLDDTAQIQLSIDNCAHSGGGILRFSARTYEIKPIKLRTGVYLWLEKGTKLQAVRDKTAYAPAFIGWKFKGHEALISGVNIRHAGVLGSGTIDGSGDYWWADAINMHRENRVARLYPEVPDANGMPRPWLVEFYQSSDIRISGVKLTNAPMWSLVLRYVRQSHIDHLTVRNPRKSPNTDGIDIVSSQHIDMSDLYISTGDDNVTIKSGLAEFSAPTIKTSDISLNYARFGFGHGFSIGSETVGGVSNITLENAVFDGTANGIRIKTGRDRGSDIGNINVNHIRMDDVGTAISISAYYPHAPMHDDSLQGATKLTPYIHDISISDLKATNIQSAGAVIGLPESPIRGVSLKNVKIDAATGLHLRNAQLIFSSSSLNIDIGSAIDQQRNVKLTMR